MLQGGPLVHGSAPPAGRGRDAPPTPPTPTGAGVNLGSIRAHGTSAVPLSEVFVYSEGPDERG